MNQISSEIIGKIVYDTIGEIAVTLRPDYKSELIRVKDEIQNERYDFLNEKERDSSIEVINTILENAQIAQCDDVPICQDTGSVWVCLEIGPDITIRGDIFSEVNSNVAKAYKDFGLRMSIVKDAIFDRTNTENNTPAFCEVKVVDKPGATLHIMLKGGGSDNASRVVMLAPGSGRKGIVDSVVECVREKAANACPPLVLGIGIGATFDKVASYAKYSLLNPINDKNKPKEILELESEIYDACNNLKIGPGALGGFPTVLGVNIITEPCHIAALPLAINMGCCAMRSKSIPLI